MRVLWGLFATSLLVGLSGAVAPGPLLTAVIGDVARTGFWTAPLLVLGHALLELVTVLALARGLARAIRNPTVLRTIAALGGITLLVLGGDLARSAWIGAVHLDEAQTASAAALPILTGVVVSVSNPYWVLWWVNGRRRLHGPGAPPRDRRAGRLLRWPHHGRLRLVRADSTAPQRRTAALRRRGLSVRYRPRRRLSHGHGPVLHCPCHPVGTVGANDAGGMSAPTHSRSGRRRSVHTHTVYRIASQSARLGNPQCT